MKYNVKREKINSATAFEEGNLAWCYILTNLDKEQIVFELALHLSNDTSFYVRSVTPCKLKPIGIEQLGAKQVTPHRVIREKEDSIPLSNTSGLNQDLIPLTNGCHRFYFLYGTTKYGVVPISDDHVFNFDKDMDILSWRRLHHGLLEQLVTMNGEKITEVVHSHTPMTPYFTTISIANYMLYGCDPYGIKRLSVLSAVFMNTSYLIIFDVEEMRLTSTIYAVR